MDADLISHQIVTWTPVSIPVPPDLIWSGAKPVTILLAMKDRWRFPRPLMGRYLSHGEFQIDGSPSDWTKEVSHYGNLPALPPLD